MKIFVLTMVLIGLALIHSCKKEEIKVFNLVSFVAGGRDIKATSPDSVAVDAVFVATFSAGVDPASLSLGSIKMTRDYDASDVPLTIILTDNILTIRPTVDLDTGTPYALTISSTLHATNGLALADFSGAFKTIGTFVPSGEVAYWSFEGNPDDLLGGHDPATADVILTYVPRTNAVSTQAAFFDGQSSIEQILGGATLLTPEFTITFWMFLDSDNHLDANGVQKGSYVLGIGNYHGLEFDVHPDYDWCKISHGLRLSDGTTTTTDFQFYGNGWTKDNVGSASADSIRNGIDNFTIVNQKIDAAGLKSKLDKTWAQIAFSYDDTTKTRSLYINGDLMYQQTFTLPDSNIVVTSLRPLLKATGLVFVPDTGVPATFDDKLAFGFWQGTDATFGGSAVYSNPNANHFRGMLDDVRMFNRPLTDKEISLIYQDEKPKP